jgi:hypothetical protein
MNIATDNLTRDHEFFIRLAVRNVVCNEHGKHWDIKGGYVDSNINDRAALAARIALCAVDGKIWVAESGRDCDCVSYSRPAYQIEATSKAYWKEYTKIADWADGPFSLTIYEADRRPTEYHSRDLALEAFEDGHQHIIYA